MYRFAKRRFGEVPEPFAVVAHHPRLLLANVVHEGMLQSASKKLPANVRELAVFWTARTIGCSWCVDFGSMLQRLDGLDVERLKDIDNYATSPAYTDDERAAIAYADAMTTDPHTVTDEQVADLRRRFGDDGVIELTYQIGVENMRARMYSALGITEQGFNSGDACRVPWATEDRAKRRPRELVRVGDVPDGADLAVAHGERDDPGCCGRIAVVARRADAVAPSFAVDQRQPARRQPCRPVPAGQPEQETRHLVGSVDDVDRGARLAVRVADQRHVGMQQADYGVHVAGGHRRHQRADHFVVGTRRPAAPDSTATIVRARDASWRAAASLTPST